MMRWAICCAMSLTLSGWAGERTVTVPGKERWVAFSDLSPQGEDLTVKIVPKDCWELAGQDVTIELMDDELAWVREVHTGQEHRYKMVAGLGMSSREWIRVDGKVKYICEKKGGGAPPDFRVTVTAVDVDAQGLEQDTDEQTEETVGAFICMDTNAVLPPRKAVYVRPVEPSPQEGNQTLKWPSAVSLWTGDDLSATKLSGDSASLSPTATTTYWMQGETPAADVYLELQHTNKDGQKATDKVKVTVFKVDFDKDPVKAGICLDGENHDVRGTVTATITPKEVADQVTFESSNPNRATVAEESRADQGNSKVVTLKVTGVSATPDTEPNGDTDLRAIVDGQVCGSTKILVVIPETQAHAVDAYSLRNYVTDGNTTLWTKMSTIVTITIRDQFGAVLDPIYDGEDVVSETFSSYGGADFYPAPDDGPICRPNNDFAGGIKEDEANAELSDQVSPALTHTQVDQWTAGTLLLPGGHNNIFALYGSPTISDHLQSITVHGHKVTPDYVRTLETFPNNHPPVPFRVTDEDP